MIFKTSGTVIFLKLKTGLLLSRGLYGVPGHLKFIVNSSIEFTKKLLKLLVIMFKSFIRMPFTWSCISLGVVSLFLHVNLFNCSHINFPLLFAPSIISMKKSALALRICFITLFLSVLKVCRSQVSPFLEIFLAHYLFLSSVSLPVCVCFSVLIFCKPESAAYHAGRTEPGLRPVSFAAPATWPASLCELLPPTDGCTEQSAPSCNLGVITWK